VNALALPNTVEICRNQTPLATCPTCTELELEYERINKTARAPPRGNWKKETWRGTSNRNDRGNTKQRLKRRLWILEHFASDVAGYVRCYRCGIRLTESTMTIDRIVPGCQGGKYVPGNIRPACGPCNSLAGATVRSDG
jgi:hypothetical protein